jgi:hypothetical protein
MKTLHNWFEYNEKKKSKDIDLDDEEEKDEEEKDNKEEKPKKEKKVKEEELTNHDKMWNGVGENLEGIINIIKDKDAEEIVSMLKNKIADGKLKFKDIRSIKKTAKALKELMK